MRCPNPICREVFEVKEDAPPPESPPQAFPTEPRPSSKGPAEAGSSRSGSGSISDVIPFLQAQKAEEQGPSTPVAEPEQRVASWQNEPPAQRVASWRDEPPARRAESPSKNLNGGEAPASPPAEGESVRPQQDSPVPKDDGPASTEPPADYVRPEGQPSQRELDSLETVVPPRSRKALLLSVFMLAGVVAVLCGVAFMFFNIYIGAERNARAKAEKSFAEGSYSDATKDYEELIAKFSRSDQVKRYQFFLELAKIGESVHSPILTPSDDLLEKLRKFIEQYRDNPLFKENRKLIGAFFRKIAENLGEYAEANGDVDAIDKARKVLRESDEYVSDTAGSKAISEKLDQQKVKIVLDKKIKEIVDELEKLIATGPTVRNLKGVREKIHREGLDSNSKITEAYKQAEAKLRAGIRYVEVNAPPAQSVADRVEPSLLVTPFTTISPRPTTGPKRVVLALDRGVLYALDQATGKNLWALRVGIDTTALPVRLPATTLSPERFLVLSADRNTLMALGAQDGSVAWKHTLSAPCLGRPAVDSAAMRAYVPTYDGRVNEIELSGGVLLGYFDLQARLSLGAVLQDGTDCLFVPGDSDNVFILDVAHRQESGKPPRKKSCVGILTTGHPSGSLRSEPLVLERVDPRHVPAPGVPAPGYLMLCQTDGFDHMRLRVFTLPLEPGENQAIANMQIGGWSWFEPCHDPEKLAFVTDTGFLGLYGINQLGNDDDAVFALNREPIRLGGSDSHLVRGQVVHVLDNDYWIVAGGRLQRFHFDKFAAKQQLQPSPEWRKDVITGAPIHAGQMDENNSVLVTVTRDLTRQVTLATAVNARNGDLLWQRQLGIESLGDPVPLGDAALIVDRSGALLLVDGSARQQAGPGWQVSDTLLAEPLDGLVPGTIQLIPDGPNTLYQMAVVQQDKGRQLVVRTIHAGASGKSPSVVSDQVDIKSLPQGSAALVNGSLVMPLADTSLHQFKLPLKPGQDKGGPDWRSPQADDDARGHVVSLGGDDFLCTDGSRGLKRWSWTATEDYKSKPPPREMPARIVTAPLVQPPSPEKGTLRIWVADSQGVVSLLNGLSLATEKSWHVAGKISAGPFARGQRIYVIVDGKKLVCIDPQKDALAWQFEMADGIVGQPCLVDGMMILASAKGRFVGLDPETGQKRGPNHELNTSAAPTGTPVAVTGNGAVVPLTDGTVLFLSPQLLIDRQAAAKN